MKKLLIGIGLIGAVAVGGTASVIPTPADCWAGLHNVYPQITITTATSSYQVDDRSAKPIGQTATMRCQTSDGTIIDTMITPQQYAQYPANTAPLPKSVDLSLMQVIGL